MRDARSKGERLELRGLFYRTMVVLGASFFVIALTACGLGKAIDAFEYIGATGDVLEANGIDGGTAFDMDCDEGTGAKTVTCTGETTDGQSIESKGENFGEDNATLTVTVDGVILYDGLLKDAPGS